MSIWTSKAAAPAPEPPPKPRDLGIVGPPADPCAYEAEIVAYLALTDAPLIEREAVAASARALLARWSRGLHWFRFPANEFLALVEEIGDETVELVGPQMIRLSSGRIISFEPEAT